MLSAHAFPTCRRWRSFVADHDISTRPAGFTASDLKGGLLGSVMYRTVLKRLHLTWGEGGLLCTVM